MLLQKVKRGELHATRGKSSQHSFCKYWGWCLVTVISHRLSQCLTPRDNKHNHLRSALGLAVFLALLLLFLLVFCFRSFLLILSPKLVSTWQHPRFQGRSFQAGRAQGSKVPESNLTAPRVPRFKGSNITAPRASDKHHR